MPDSLVTRVVTGANRGIGLEVCKELLRRCPEDRLVLTCRDEESGEKLVKDFRENGASLVDFVPLDVTSQESVHGLALFLSRECGGLDVLINNAGYASKGSRLDVQIARQTLDVNLYGVQRVIHGLLPLLREGGRVVNVSSRAGTLNDAWSETLREDLRSPELSVESLFLMMEDFLLHVERESVESSGWPANAYRVSKAALNALTRLYARNWKGRDHSVYAVCPGWVKTRMGGPNAPRSLGEGAETIVWLATEKSALLASGAFYQDKQILDD